MPASAAAPPPSPSPSRPETLVSLLGSESKQVKLKALRELKNQIIGNRTKKLCYINLGTVPSILEILTSVEENGEDDEFSVSILIQSAATIGSFACGVDDGVRAVLDAGGFGKLIRLISHPDDKVVDAGARALKMIYQSKWAPKYDFNSDENMAFLLSLLNSLNENVTELGCSIITHSCETSAEQKALCEAGVLSRLIILLKGSLSQREATLDSLAAMFKNNSEVISKFVGLNGGRALNSLTELMKDKYPRTRLLACVCLAVIGHTSPSHLQDPSLRIKLITILIELFEEPGRVGDEVPFALANLITKREDLQKLAFEVNALDKLCSFLHKDTVLAKQLEGILLAISELCSSLEDCRAKFLSLQVLDLVTHALTHDCAEVRTAACICIRSVSRSVKNLSAGHFLTDTIVTSLIQLLHDQSTSVQVAALKTISNIVVDFSNRKSIFIECGGLKELVVLSKSMDSTLRQNSVWALKNLTFHAQSSHKEHILSELTASTLTSLICDSEPYIQEQALSLVRNLVDGGIPCIEHLFADGHIIIDAVGRQVRSASKSEVCIQGMFALSNIATGSDLHKEAVMEQLVSESPSIILKFLQCADSDLRLATMWCIVNLTYPGCHGTSARVARLRDSGVISEVKHLVSDPHLEVKFRVRMALEQCKAFSYKSE